MKISTKGRYALRMAVYLAKHQRDEYVSLKNIAESESISKKYLEQIVPMLNRAGLLRTTRGNKGGYLLTKKADEITVGDILRATEGNLAPIACLEYEVNDCPRKEQCSTLYIWEGLYQKITGYLDSITLQDIVEHDSNGDDYSI
ncbi:MAG: Rrf2 family transcriptional regulator [Ruminococcus sp.]|nr:Rrf2 family transcriptional regulator [Ruminococcus sp.]